MFDIGGGELVVIGIVALVAIGPKELPTVLRTVGRYMGKIRRMSAEFQGQFQEAMREAEMSDLKKHADDLKSSFTNFDPLSENKPAETPDAGSTAETVAAAAAADMAAANASGADMTAASPPPDLAAPPIDVPLPEPLPPVTNADFAPAEPASAEPAPAEAPKRAGDAA
ncbi:MAG: Sec-independent protein translocase protein TatB [Pseudolabrys sp.]